MLQPQLRLSEQQKWLSLDSFRSVEMVWLHKGISIYTGQASHTLNNKVNGMNNNEQQKEASLCGSPDWMWILAIPLPAHFAHSVGPKCLPACLPS